MKDSNNVHSFFNATENYLHQSFGIRIRAEIVRELTGSLSDRNIIDVGCGNGVISSQFIGSNTITFLDLSENMIGHVKKYIVPEDLSRARFLVGSFTEIEIDDTYDYVFAIGLMAHVPSVSKCIERISIILKSEGSAIIQFSNAGHWLTRFNINNATNYGYPVNKLKYAEMKALISSNGFEIKEEIRFSLLFPGMGKLPEKFLYWYSKIFWKRKFFAQFGTDFIWYLKKVK